MDPRDYRIRVDTNKCTGCRHCEVACSLAHTGDRSNYHRARIRVIALEDRFLPLMAGPYVSITEECASKKLVNINGFVYDQCVLCRASCPNKSIFKEPDSGIPLKCDFCGFRAEGPACIQWCTSGALTLIKIKPEAEEEL
ncbi:MAG: (4Fe-4S)-binding protein [Candidatus Desulfofervidaceae bacterium]|nr:(4Fe-4S)-binding protein [Candidatus Desulfofervidaceae bacterium]MDL1970210.1 (4Fe-4S)-binding protein [Candidatus Desulfofervidaceae bacterium]